MLERYYIEKEKQEKLLSRKNVKSDFYNGIYDRYEYPVLTREHIPLTWRYDLNPKTNPYFMERLGINAVMNSGAIELNGIGKKGITLIYAPTGYDLAPLGYTGPAQYKELMAGFYEKTGFTTSGDGDLMMKILD